MGTDAAKSSSDPPFPQDVDATALVDLSNSSYIPSPFSSAEENVGVDLYPPFAQRLQNGRESMLELLGQTTNAYLLEHYNEGGSSGMLGPLQSLVQSFATRAGEKTLLPCLDEEFDPSSRAECSRRCIAQSDVEGSPERIMLDESGYDSSESSVYEVASDDENYGKDFAIFGEDEVATENQIFPSAQESPVAEGQIDTNGNGHDSADEDEQVPDCPCLSGNPYMHVMSKVADSDTDDTAQTWKRRTTNPKGESRPHSRVARCMGPIEIALRNAPNRKTKYIFEPMLGITFDSEDEAYNFYNMYSWERGFGIKKDTLVTNNEGTRTKRDLRCLCSGNAGQAKFKSKKTGCPAMIRLLRSEDDGWYISRYVAEHNHTFTETCGQTNEWKSHGGLDASAMEMIKYLRENNVSLAKVHCIMGSMYGSMENIPITKRSMRAICRQIAKDQMDNDVQKTLETFRQVRRQDPGFQCSVEVDEKDRIKTLLWINGKSREDYKYFGDVITFDTTYSTNIYKMSFGLFVGVNNHFQSVIFGGVFMREETTKSFKWVFTEFASLMGGKVPQTVFTDQCAAMASALSQVWGDAKHLLCKWHIFKDAGAMLGPLYRKGSPFRKLFHKIINGMLTIDEFERAWDYMIKLYNLMDNKYLQNIYDKREKWAKPYFRDSFCARMSSTQRSESANHMLKRFVPRNCSMNRFVVQFNKLLFTRNRDEDRAEFDTKIFKDVRERAWPIEDHAKEFYTSATYGLFRNEISKATRYFAKEVIPNKEYDVVHVKPNKKHAWGRDKYTVLICNEGDSYDCECGLYRHFGMLCSHVLRVMNQLGVYQIPKQHINKRWTRSARDMLPEGLMGYQKDTLCMNSMTYRHGYLYVNALGVVKDGNRDLGTFEIVAKDLKKLQKKLRAYFKAKENTTSGLRIERLFPATDTDVGADSGYDTDARIGNSYGAAGSSAGMSDSELLRIRAPAFNRPVGRPKETRFKGAQDYYGKKQKKRKDRDVDNGEKTQPKKKQLRCGGCELLGHTAAQCKKKKVDLNTELPEF